MHGDGSAAGVAWTGLGWRVLLLWVHMAQIYIELGRRGSAVESRRKERIGGDVGGNGCSMGNVRERRGAENARENGGAGGGETS